MVEVEAVSLITPSNPGGSPTSWRSQSIVSSSSSVAAGELRHTMAFTFTAAASISPRIPGADPEMAK